MKPTVSELVREMELNLISAWDCVRVNANALDRAQCESRKRVITEVQNTIRSLRVREKRLKELIQKISEVL